MPKYKPWAARELKIVQRLINKAIDIDYAMELLPGRSRAAIINRARLFRRTADWTDQEISQVVSFTMNRIRYSDLKKSLINRHSEPAIRQMIDKQMVIYGYRSPAPDDDRLPPTRNLKLLAAAPSRRHLYL